MCEQLAPQNHDFGQIISIIEGARDRAPRAVNSELIQMYWNVGEYLSDLCANAVFGDKIIDEVAAYIANSGTKIRGFNRRGLYRMKQFYETYRDDEFVTPLVTQISWTNHLQIMFGAKSADERHFYLQLCAKEHYSKRELERQIDSAYYERSMLSTKYVLSRTISPPLVADYTLYLSDKKVLQDKLCKLTDVALDAQHEGKRILFISAWLSKVQRLDKRLPRFEFTIAISCGLLS